MGVIIRIKGIVVDGALVEQVGMSGVEFSKACKGLPSIVYLFGARDSRATSADDWVRRAVPLLRSPWGGAIWVRQMRAVKQRFVTT